MAGKRRKKGAKRSFRGFSVGRTIAPLGGLLFKHIGSVVLIIILLSGFYWFHEYYLMDDSFDVQNIIINKTRFISRENVLRIARIHTGGSIFDIDLADSAARLERLPRIKRAEIKRLLPHTIHITILERTAVAQVKLPFRNKYYLIDGEGCVLVPVLKSPHKDLVIIDARFSRQSRLTPGDYFFSRLVQKGLQLINRLQHHPVLENESIVSIEIDKAGNMTTALSDSLEIKFGKNIDDAVTKLNNIRQILDDPQRDLVNYIDLRFKDIVVKKK